MAERTSITEVVQLGVESVPGTPVAAARRLQSLSFELSPNIETTQFRPQGQKYKTLVIEGKEWSEGSLSGNATYDELIYPLSSVIDAATVSTVGTTGKQWAFASDPVNPDAPVTYTMEQGSSFRAHRAAYGIVNQFGMTFTRDSVELSGSTFSMAIEDGITLTGSPTEIPLIPILPQDVCIYVNDTFATIGTTKLTRVTNFEWQLGSRYGMFWPIDCTLDSFGGHIETEPDLTVGMRLEADASGMQFLNQVRAGTTKYIRVAATGGTIAGSSPSTPYSLQLDFAVKVTDTDGFTDDDGLYAIEWNFVGVKDTDIPGGLNARVVNTRATL